MVIRQSIIIQSLLAHLQNSQNFAKIYSKKKIFIQINMKTNFNNLKKALAVAAGTALQTGHAFAQGTGFISATDNPNRISAATGGQTSARLLVLTIVNYFLGFLGLVAVLMIIYGGFLVLTAGQDDGKAKKGKQILTLAITGIIIILLSFALVTTILGAGSGQDA